MANSTSGAIDHIVSDFNKLKADQDFSGVAAELVALQKADHTHFQGNLAEINRQVDMKKLGFSEDFQIVGIKGNQFVARSEDGKQIEYRQMNNMNAGQATDNAGTMQPVGETAVDSTTGAKTDHYHGYLDDSHVFGLTQTGFRAEETVDKNGLLAHRNIQYDSGWGLPNMQLQTPDGPISISHVSSVDTTLSGASGNYLTVIQDFGGNRWQAVTGADGKVTSFKPIDKAPEDPASTVFVPMMF